MDIKKILDNFAKYTDYNPEQRSFNLLSTNYFFHEAGKKIEKTLNKYDPSGVLGVMYAKKAFLDAADGCRINLLKYLTDEEVRLDVQNDMKMYQELCDPAVEAAEETFINEMNKLVLQATGKAMIGNRDIREEKDAFINTVVNVIDDLEKCRLDVFKKGERIGTIGRFTTRILLFEKMADCLLHIEKQEDALYFCYINQGATADGYFSFVIKNNGNVISVCDRIDEEYIGQHSHSRNNRWAEAHADNLFPYDFIFKYEDHDYKGYATKYVIDDEKLEFMKLPPEVYEPILVAMVLIKHQYENKEVDGKVLYLNTLVKDEYYLENHPGTDLMVLNKSEIAVYNKEYSCDLSLQGIMDGTYNKKYDMNDSGTFWVDLYGDGFVPEYTGLLSSLNGAEFLGDADKLDRENYRKIRIQLAEYIRKNMEKEYDDFGGKNAIESYWMKQTVTKKDEIIDAICRYQYLREHPELKATNKIPDVGFFEYDLANTEIPELYKKVSKTDEMPCNTRCLNSSCFYSHNGRYIEEVVDDITQKKCSIFFKVDFDDYRQMEALVGSLPKIYKGYTSKNSGNLGYNGNPLLDATDAVGSISSPLYGGYRPDGERKYSQCNFNVWIGFSKIGWKKTYEKWLFDHDLQDEIGRKEKERKEKLLQKKNEIKPIVPYKPLSFGKEYENSEEAEKLNQELYSVSPELRIGDISMDDANNIICVSCSIKQKGNAEIINKLYSLGWRKRYRSKGFNGEFYIKLEKNVKCKEEL